MKVWEFAQNTMYTDIIKMLEFLIYNIHSAKKETHKGILGISNQNISVTL